MDRQLSNKELFQQGVEYFNQSKYLEAIDIFSTLLISEEREQIRYYLALCYRRLEKFEIAAKHLSILLDYAKGKTRENALMLLVGIEMMQENYDEALKLSKAMQPNQYNTLNMGIMYCMKYEKEKNTAYLDEALRLMDEADSFELVPAGKYRQAQARGFVNQARKNYQTAEAYYQLALDYAENDEFRGNIRNYYADLLIESGRYAEAETMLYEAKEYLEGQTELTRTLQLLDQLDVLHRKTDELVLKNGLDLYSEAKYLEAIEIFSSLLAKGENHSAQLYLALCYYHLEYFDIAYKHVTCLQTHTSGETKERALDLITLIDLSENRYDRVIHQLESKPQNPMSQYNLSLAYWKKYQAEHTPDSLEQSLQTLSHISSDTSIQYKIDHLKALIFQEKQDYSSAESLYNAAISMEKCEVEQGTLFSDYATLLIACERYEEAERLLFKARELVVGKSQIQLSNCNQLMEQVRLHKTEKNKALLQKGIDLFEKKQYLASIEILSSLLPHFHDLTVRKYLGDCYYRLRNFELAHKHFSYLYNHADGTMRDYSASVLVAIALQLENYDQALTLVRTLPPDENNLFNLALALWKKYKIEKDKSLLKEALQNLNKVNSMCARVNIVGRVSHLKALIYQSQQDIRAAEEYYQQSLAHFTRKIDRGSVLNDYASMLIECGRIDEAESVLLSAKDYLSGDVRDDVQNQKLLDLVHQHQIASFQTQLAQGKQLYQSAKYLEAIEIFSALLSIQDHVEARMYLAACHYRLENYEVAYKHLTNTFDRAEDEQKEIIASMLVAIDIIWGNHNKAIKMLKKLPKSIPNQINLCLLYWKKFKSEKDECSIREALNILNQIDASSANHHSLQKVYHLKGLFYQAQQLYNLAETNYKTALEYTTNDTEKGSILNDYASLFIECEKLDEAENMLYSAKQMVKGKDRIHEAFNNKWLGIISMNKNKYDDAKKYLENAARLIKEKGLLEEIAVVNFLLAKLHQKGDFYKAADYYADGVTYERLAEEVNERDEKILSFYLSSFLKHFDNTPSTG